MSEEKGAVTPRSNMETTCFHSSENIYFEPLKLAGLVLYLLDISRNV